MSTLDSVIAAEIARNGALTFARFMEMALYKPALGYYASGKAQIGRGGDFLTSVSVGPLFGKLLTAQFREMWANLSYPPEFTLVEQGANNGDFAHDVLTAARALGENCGSADSSAARGVSGFYEALRIVIVEPFPANEARQRERLKAFDGKATWVDSLEHLPPFTGVHFSNELLDAMPVHLLLRRGGEWRERYVQALDDSANGSNSPSLKPEGIRFQFTEGALSCPALEAFLPFLPNVEGYETEINLSALKWVTDLAPRLTRGYVLVADYGFCRADFFHPDRTRGTLLCYRQHKKSEDPLSEVGEKDITIHVEFSSVAEAAHAAGFTLAGFTDQHHFLVGLSKQVFSDSSAPLSAAQQSEMRKLATLMHPAMMGRGFQFLALAKDAPLGLGGFEFAKEARQALWPT